MSFWSEYNLFLKYFFFLVQIILVAVKSYQFIGSIDGGPNEFGFRWFSELHDLFKSREEAFNLNVKKKLKMILSEYIIFDINTRMGNEGVDLKDLDLGKNISEDKMKI